jgi:hypothetical protein
MAPLATTGTAVLVQRLCIWLACALMMVFFIKAKDHLLENTLI